jgi:SAM-dependent methyltransferase
MTDPLVTLVRCPACLALLARETTGTGSALRCTTCARTYPIVHGVPWMASGNGIAARNARSFAFQWRARAKSLFERGTLYGMSREQEERHFLEALGIGPQALTGRTVLDAGCGDGFLLTVLAQYPAEVFGIDINTAVRPPELSDAHPGTVTVLQADLFAPPFAAETFDFVWCEGVLVHTADPRSGFRTLTELVKPGGRLYVWVYPSERRSVYQRVRDLVPVAHRVPWPLLLLLCYVLAIPLTVAKRLRHRGQRDSLRTVAFALFDNLSPPIQSRHTASEVRSWFEENGFADLKQTGLVGMSGTKARR